MMSDGGCVVSLRLPQWLSQEGKNGLLEWEDKKLRPNKSLVVGIIRARKLFYTQVYKQ